MFCRIELHDLFVDVIKAYILFLISILHVYNILLLLCIHENIRRFESQNGSHMAWFSAPMCSCGQRITRHNANYAQMPGSPLCSI